MLKLFKRIGKKNSVNPAAELDFYALISEAQHGGDPERSN